MGIFPILMLPPAPFPIPDQPQSEQAEEPLDSSSQRLVQVSSGYAEGETQATGVSGVKLIKLVQRGDQRGDLAILGQGDAHFPFVPARLFLTYRSNELSRGSHAHRECEQLLICVTGSVKVLVNDGMQKEVIPLNSPSEAVYIGPMVWAEEFDHTSDAVILVLASHAYDETDYIRDYEQWKQTLTLQRTDV
jgi:UDP-2-acetamido-3-amino-2,3-dideoxy-glucuronate N-acetyltransferase